MKPRIVMNCIRCGSEYIYGTTSSAQHCSEYCVDDEEKWVDQVKESKREESKTAKEKGESMQTQSGEQNIWPQKSSQEKTIERMNSKDQETTMKTIETESYQDSTPTVSSDHLQNLPESLKRDALESLNMLTDVNKELLTSMRRLVRNDADTIKLMNPDIGRAVADCGKQLINSMRMKLDIYRFAKDVIEMERK